MEQRREPFSPSEPPTKLNPALDPQGDPEVAANVLRELQLLFHAVLHHGLLFLFKLSRKVVSYFREALKSFYYKRFLKKARDFFIGKIY